MPPVPWCHGCAAFDFLHAAQVDAVVRERFGGPACRIFRLLLLKRQLEQKQIAEMAMIPVKDTRELLYKLVKVEFVQLQEVARTADHSPSRTFYLWRVRLRQRRFARCAAATSLSAGAPAGGSAARH
jgi:hypothetical protein